MMTFTKTERISFLSLTGVFPQLKEVVRGQEMIVTKCQLAIYAGLRDHDSKSKRAINLEPGFGVLFCILPARFESHLRTPHSLPFPSSPVK